MSIELSVEDVLKRLIVEYCRRNFIFTNQIRIVGSVHVVVDNNEVLSCLLNETRSNIKPVESAPVVTPTPIDANQPNKLNKRKRFVPRVHHDPVKVENVDIEETSNFGDEFVNDSINEFDESESFKTKTSICQPKTGLLCDVTNYQSDSQAPENEFKPAIKSGSDGGEYECDEEMAGVMNSTSKRKLSQSGRAEVGEYECVPCKRSFKYYCYYKRHMDARHTDEPKYICEVCNKSYKWEASYRHHLRSHFGNESGVIQLADDNKEN